MTIRFAWSTSSLSHRWEASSDDNDPKKVERAHKVARTNSEAHDMWAFLHPPFPSEVHHMANPPAVAEADEETTGAVLPEVAEATVPH